MKVKDMMLEDKHHYEDKPATNAVPVEVITEPYTE